MLDAIEIVNGLMNSAIVAPIKGIIPTTFLNKGTTNTNTIPKTIWIIKFNQYIKPKKIPGFLNNDFNMQNRAKIPHAATMKTWTNPMILKINPIVDPTSSMFAYINSLTNCAK